MTRLLYVLILLLATAASSAQPNNPRYDFPVLDLPFNTTQSGRFPSMAQSLALSQNYYQFAHSTLADSLGDHDTRWGLLAIAGFDLLSTWLPPGNSWLHEEWHRAVLSRRGISSYNEVYKVPIFSDSISVSHVQDEALAALKRDHPTEIIRLHLAGIEAQYELNASLERDKFFNASRSFDTLLLWLNTTNSIGYLDTCSSDEANELTDEFRQAEGPDIANRDFAGLDCAAWVYDLFRPDEPYAARGTHPSGSGIDRYRAWRDLRSEEQNYLRHQRNLSLLNLVDPFLFGIQRFTARHPLTGAPVEWNSTLRHDLTPFGYSIGWNLFVRDSTHAGMLTLRYNAGHNTSGPGLELRWPKPFTISDNYPAAATARLAAWLQPSDQQFHATRTTAGGLAAIRISNFGTHTWRPYLELEAKSAGWVAGNVYLDRNLSLRVGVQYEPQL